MKTTPILASMALLVSLGACGGDDDSVGLGAQESAAEALCRAVASFEGCGAESACTQALVADCADVAGILADPFLDAARTCIESGTAPTSCLATAGAELTPTEAQRAFAKQFCSACAFGVPGCEDTLFGSADGDVAVAGALILPLGDSVVAELADECASGIGCAATFMNCAEGVLAKRAIPEETLKCVLHSLTTPDPGAPECGSASSTTSTTSTTSSGTGGGGGGGASASTGAGAGGPGGCTSSSDCATGELCEAGKCIGTETVCFDSDLMIYPLTLTKGDSEFDGNGPDVELTVKFTRTSTSITAEACVTMTETQADWTTGTGCAQKSLAVPNTGFVSDTSFSAEYLDGDGDPDDVFVDSFTIDKADVVESAWCQGDTAGADICGDTTSSCSLCVLHLGCVTVKQAP